MGFEIHALRALKDNYIYALTGPAGDCVVIDPGETKPVLAFLAARSLTLTHILCTHHHADHTGGIAELRQRFPVPVWCSAPDRARIETATQTVGESENLSLLGSEVRILAVPGHTVGQIAYWLPREKALFVGDTLFSCGCGRLFEGSPEQMFASLQKIAALPPETAVYFGHEYTLNNISFVLSRGVKDAELLRYQRRCEEKIERGEGTTPGRLDEELRLNPFLYARSVAEFKAWREARNHW